jgi:fructose-1-phosphate kinase PfkB-like protein
VLDTSGPALALGMQAGPWAAKVNREELTGVRDRLPPPEPDPPGKPPPLQALVRLLARVVRAGVTFAVVTMGRDGLLACDGRTVWRGELPGDLEVVQPVGSGNAATAALAVGLARLLDEGALTTAKWPDLGFQGLPAERKADLVRAMVAAAAANAVTEGIGTCPREVFESVHRRVRVSAEPLASRK